MTALCKPPGGLGVLAVNGHAESQTTDALLSSQLRGRGVSPEKCHLVFNLVPFLPPTGHC